MSFPLPFGQLRSSPRECELGDFIISNKSGPQNNRRVVKPSNGTIGAVMEFTLVLLVEPAGEQWVWKRVS